MTTSCFMTQALLADAMCQPHTTIWAGDGWVAPKGFPRRELLCCPTIGGKTWRVKTQRLLKFLRVVTA